MMTTNVWLKQVRLHTSENLGFDDDYDMFQTCLSVCLHLTGVERLQASLEAIGLRQRDVHQGAVGAHMGAGYCPLQQVRLIAFVRPHQPASDSLGGLIKSKPAPFSERH